MLQPLLPDCYISGSDGGTPACWSLAAPPAAAWCHTELVHTRPPHCCPCADKGHTTERSRNPNGSLSGADRSTARDAAFWDEQVRWGLVWEAIGSHTCTARGSCLGHQLQPKRTLRSTSCAVLLFHPHALCRLAGVCVARAQDVYRRMDFSLRCAYAHGTSALRTHLINMTPKQTQLTWPVFSRLRKKWAGKVGARAQGGGCGGRACAVAAVAHLAPAPVQRHGWCGAAAPADLVTRRAAFVCAGAHACSFVALPGWPTLRCCTPACRAAPRCARLPCHPPACPATPCPRPAGGAAGRVPGGAVLLPGRGRRHGPR